MRDSLVDLLRDENSGTEQLVIRRLQSAGTSQAITGSRSYARADVGFTKQETLPFILRRPSSVSACRCGPVVVSDIPINKRVAEGGHGSENRRGFSFPRAMGTGGEQIHARVH